MRTPRRQHALSQQDHDILPTKGRLTSVNKRVSEKQRERERGMMKKMKKVNEKMNKNESNQCCSGTALVDFQGDEASNWSNNYRPPVVTSATR